MQAHCYRGGSSLKRAQVTEGFRVGHVHSGAFAALGLGHPDNLGLGSAAGRLGGDLCMEVGMQCTPVGAQARQGRFGLAHGSPDP